MTRPLSTRVCSICGDAIRPGSETTDVGDEYVHAACAEIPFEGLDEPRPVCPKCWITISKSGACGCD